MKKLAATSLLSCLFAWCSQADEVVWTGGAGALDGGAYSFGDPNNWNPKRRPTDADVAVFRTEGTLTVDTTNVGGGDTKVGSFRFESGSTYFTKGNDYWYMMAPTTEVYVATGAFASLTNVLSAGWGDRKPFVKTGGGTAEFARLSSVSSFSLKDLIVREGVLQGTSDRVAAYTEKITVCAGATYATGNDKLAAVAPEVELEAGGTLLLNAQGAQVSVAGLRGEGCVADAGNGSRILIAPTADCLFAGTIGVNVAPTVSPDATGRLVLGATNVFERAGTTVASRRLAFAADVPGPFVFGDDYRVNAGYPLELTDLDGKPVTVVAGLSADIANLRTSGLGSLYSKAGNLGLDSRTKLAHRGTLGWLSGTIGIYDLDISHLGALEALGGELKFWSPATVDIPVLGSWSMTVVGKSQFGNLCLRPAAGRNLFVYLYEDCTMTGGITRLSYRGISYKAAGKTFELSGGELDSREDPPPEDNITVLPVRKGLVFDADAGKAGACFRVSGSGEMWLSGYANCGVPVLEQTGGTIHWADSYSPWAGATTANPSIVKFDGGTVYAKYDVSNFSLFADEAKLRVGVGAKGGCFRQEQGYYKIVAMTKTFSAPLVSFVDGGTDGGAAFFGFAPWDFPYPLSITGPFRGIGGAVRIPAAGDLDGNPAYFGTGDVLLENEQLVLRSRTASATLRLGTAVDKKMSVRGGVVVKTREAATDPAQAVEMGALDRAAGGALFLWDATADVGASGASTVRAAGVTTQSATGRVLQPVFGFDGSWLAYLGYDPTTGFKKLEGVVTDETLADVEGKVARVTSGWTTTAAGARRHVDALVLEKDAALAISSGTTVTVGDGTNPGVVLMNKSYIQNYGTGDSAGALDFGAAEGLVVAAGNGPRPCGVGNELLCVLKGSAGVSYVAPPDDATFKSIRVSQPNAYDGVTRINAVAVRADHVACFSKGDVHVGDGEHFGGSVMFNVENGVWANDFHLAGWGNRRNPWNDRDYPKGAFVFLASGEVSGDVELTTQARMSAAADTTGVLSGVVSGDRLEVFDSRGVLKLAGSNTYTGGTEVIAGTLALVKADSAGTGAILLDGGTLRFENTEPIVFANEVRGIGTVEFAGTAPVTLASAAFASLPFRTFTAGTTLDFPDFAACTLKIAVDGDLDLGGRTVAVAGVAGSGRVAGGTLVVTGEINPGGIGAVGTLTFETAPVVTGAKLVCELSETAADRLVVEDDFDLSALAFEVKRLARFRGSATVVETAGDLSGSFLSTTFPHGSYAVDYSAKAAVLTCDGGLMLILR